MALTGKITPGNEQEKKFTAEFTNGTIKQLNDLANYLEGEDFTMPEEEGERLKEVVRIGISWLERMKESSKKKDEPK